MRLRKGKVVWYHGRLWRVHKWTYGRWVRSTGVMLLEHGKPRRQARAAFAYVFELEPATRVVRRWAHEMVHRHG